MFDATGAEDIYKMRRLQARSLLLAFKQRRHLATLCHTCMYGRHANRHCLAVWKTNKWAACHTHLPPAPCSQEEGRGQDRRFLTYLKDASNFGSEERGSTYQASPAPLCALPTYPTLHPAVTGRFALLPSVVATPALPPPNAMPAKTWTGKWTVDPGPGDQLSRVANMPC